MSFVESPHPTPVDSKEAVLDAAQRLITQHGYAGFSMRDLAQQSGLAKATLYHHFTDKREILQQVLQRDVRIVSDSIATAAATPGDLSTRLGSVATAFFKLTNERGMLLLTTLREASAMEREFCALIQEYRDVAQQPIIALLDAAVAAGTIRPVNTELAAMSFFGILQAFSSRHLLMKDLELNEKAVDFVLDFIFNGLLSTPSSDRA